MNTNSKRRCETLKAIREQIAALNDIEYSSKECHFKGECKGTCPACEQERQYLEKQLKLRQKAGKNIKIIGIATGVSFLVACGENHQLAKPVCSQGIEPSQTDVEGDIAYIDEHAPIPEEKGVHHHLTIINGFDTTIYELPEDYPTDKDLVFKHKDSTYCPVAEKTKHDIR